MFINFAAECQLYFKTHRETYYNHLQSVRKTGDWESWICFFLEGVILTAEQAVETAQKIVQLIEKDQQKIKTLGRSAPSVLAVHHELQKHPISTISKIAKKCKLTIPTVTKALQLLINLKIVQEITGKERHRIYQYEKYLEILDQEIGVF